MLRPGLLLVTAAVLVSSISARVNSQTAMDSGAISGLYYCKGTDASGVPYEGVVRIAEHGRTVLVQWSFGSQLTGIGFGVVNGDSLAVSYLGPTPGVALYRLDGDQLVGTWTEPEAGGAVFPETLTRVPPGETAPVPPPRSAPEPRGTPGAEPSGRQHLGIAA